MGFAYLPPSGFTPFLTRRARSTSTSSLPEPRRQQQQLQQQQQHREIITATTTAAAAHRNHDSHWQQQQRQCDHPRPRQRHRHAYYLPLGAAVAGEDAAPRLGRRSRSGGADKDGRNWGEIRFTEMMQLRTQVAAKVNVSRVLQDLRDDGAEFNLRTYRGCLAFLAKGGRGQEALKYLREMEVR